MPTFEEVFSDNKTYPDDTQVTLADGVPVTLGTLRKGYLRNSDYTRKTMELADQRRQFDQDRAANDAALAQAREDLTKLAEQATRQPNPQQLTPEEQIEQTLRSDPYARQLRAEIHAANARAERIEKQWQEAQHRQQEAYQEQLRRWHESRFAEIAAKDPDADLDAVRRHALQRGMSDPVVAWEHMTEKQRWDKRERDIRDEERRKAEESAKLHQQQPLPTRTSFVPPSLGKEEPQTMDAAVEAAANDPELQDPQKLAQWAMWSRV